MHKAISHFNIRCSISLLNPIHHAVDKTSIRICCNLAIICKAAVDKRCVRDFSIAISQPIKTALQKLRVLQSSYVSDVSIHIQSLHNNAALQRISMVNLEISLNDGGFVCVGGIFAETHTRSSQGNGLGNIYRSELTAGKRDDISVRSGSECCLQC